MRFSTEQETRIVNMYQEGTSTNNIGKLLGFHQCYAVAVLKKNGIPLRTIRRITPSEALDMADTYRTGITGTEIATRFATTPTAVYAALARQGIDRRAPNNGFVGECDHEFFNIIDTEPKAYLLSALAGDGCVTRPNEIILDLQYSDRALVEAFRSALRIGNPVRYLESEKVFNGYCFTYRHARVSVNSPRLAAALAGYGIVPAKTGRTRPALIPGEVPVELERHYWRGWVDTDGWVCSGLNPDAAAIDDRREQFKVGLTGDRLVVEAFRSFCMRHTPTLATIQPNHNIWSFSVTDSYAMHIASLLYDGSAIYLDRKYQVYLQWRALRPDWIQ